MKQAYFINHLIPDPDCSYNDDCRPPRSETGGVRIQFQVEFYETEDGKIPAQEFLDSLEPKMNAKMVGLMEILEEKGSLLREPYSAPLEDGIFELRAVQGSNISCALFFFHTEGRIIITHGFIKKTQKTPRAQIELAKKYRDDFLKRQ